MFLTQRIIEGLQSKLVQDAQAFLPELILCGTIVVLLLLRLFTALDRLHLGWVALLGTLGALVMARLNGTHASARPTTRRNCSPASSFTTTSPSSSACSSLPLSRSSSGSRF